MAQLVLDMCQLGIKLCLVESVWLHSSIMSGDENVEGCVYVYEENQTRCQEPSQQIELL